MENIFIISTIIAIVYSIARFIEMRFILKENRPIKDMVRDSVIVYVSSMAGGFIFDQLNPITSAVKAVTGEKTSSTGAFVDEPNF
mgnify:CR=1 FL=1|tara:strand:+ start:277 stop:531 length:255 start_codon:yes stop_codon:yes gene_type:complete